MVGFAFILKSFIPETNGNNNSLCLFYFRLERAELHDVPRLLNFARDLVYRLQALIPSSVSIAGKPKGRATTKSSTAVFSVVD